MKIKYFAWIKDITEKEKEIINDPNINNIDDLKKYLQKKYPKIEKHMQQDLIRIAINYEYCVKNISLSPNDEIAIFPPVSGG